MSGAVEHSGGVGDRHPSVVALTGFMGSGKTSVGRAMAAKLGWEFVDLDSVIEASAGRTIREIFQSDGEEAFRAVEQATLVSVVEGAARPTVLALGGGAFVQASNAQFLRRRGVRTVFLEVPVDEMLTRCGIEDPAKTAIRPLVSDPEAFRKLYEARLVQYRGADFTLTEHGTTAADRAERVIRMLGLEPL